MRRFANWTTVISLGILSLLFLHQLAFTDLILARGDTYTYFYPYWDIRNSAMQAGALPLWNTDIFMGIPLLANPQLGTFYPPNWLTIPFVAPDAVRISILLHMILGSWGMFFLFRVTTPSDIIAACTASLVFVFGGYVVAHIEQINQLQGIIWIPWLVLALHQMMTSNRPVRYALVLGILWALQIFSGHTQTVFISGITLGLYALFLPVQDSNQLVKVARRILSLGGAALLAVILAIPQLLPALELTGMSNRGGGLNTNEATAFSLPPNALARALLPSYDGLLFTEYIAYVGVIALSLAIFAVFSSQDRREQRIWIIFAGLGIIFALGRFTPVYATLANLPGFDLFRAPSRWLALYAIGIAMLAGHGIIALRRTQFNFLRTIITSTILVLGMALAWILPISPDQMTFGAGQVTLVTVALWGVALVGFIIALYFARHPVMPTLVLVAIGIELFLALKIMPVNQLVPRDVYLGQRFTVSQMLALTQDDSPPPRFLAMSGLLFNPGDVNTLRVRYDRLGIDENAQQIAFTAVKGQEVIFRNLGMSWGIPTVDGYGGGVLPAIYYSQFTSLVLPDGNLRLTDGRLGEELAEPSCRGACIPYSDWLNLTDTGYIITDKNFDVSHNGIFFDTSLNEYWSKIPAQPEFVFDSVQVLLSEPVDTLETDNFEFLGSTYYLVTMGWADFTKLLREHHPLVLGASIVNERTNTFQQLTPAGFTRVLSSDIKIYEHESSERAFLVSTMATTPDDWDGHEAALDILRDSSQTVVIHDAPRREGTQSGTVEVTQYTDTHIEINVTSDADAYLYLADAYYPGWQATVNGISATVYRANVMFRAVPVPAGESTVVFEFVPRLWYRAIIFGIVAWGIAIVLLIAMFLRINRQN